MTSKPSWIVYLKDLIFVRYFWWDIICASTDISRPYALHKCFQWIKTCASISRFSKLKFWAYFLNFLFLDDLIHWSQLMLGKLFLKLPYCICILCQSIYLTHTLSRRISIILFLSNTLTLSILFLTLLRYVLS